MKRPVIVFTGGGTGGHVFPALAVLEELESLLEGNFLWIGSAAGPERRIVRRRGVPFRSIPAGKLRRYFSLRNLLDLFRIVGGWVASLMLLLHYRPAVVFSKGGFVSVPVVMAARTLGVPVFSHECDLTPGLATRINAMASEKLLVSFPETVGYLSPRVRGRTAVVGNPVRREILEGSAGTGRRITGCAEGRGMILFTGGSSGARAINEALAGCLEELTVSWFVVHQYGGHGFDLRASGGRSTYYGAPFFTEEFPHLLAAADLVVCRAGANNISELAVLGKPAVLIPLPLSASRGDQLANARLWARQGAAVRVEQKDLTSTRLLEEVTSLMGDSDRLAEMGRCARSLSHPDAARRIAELTARRAASGRAIGQRTAEPTVER